MATEQQFIDNTNTRLPSGSNIPSSDHRDTMTGSNGVLGLVYLDSILDRTNQSPELQVVTTKAGNDVIYTCVTQKVGRGVTMSITLSNNTAAPLSFPNVFTITLAEYLQDSNSYRASAVNNAGGSVEILLLNNILKVNGTLGIGEYFSFIINYSLTS